jgi:2-keto-4-pentenoate hydratase
MTDRDTIAAQAAARLMDASRTRVPCAPVRDLLGVDDVDLAYTVQQQVVEDRLRAGARVTGRKIGLTNPAVQAQLGVDRPDSGVLFDDMDVTALDAVPGDRLLQPRVEAEIAFVLAEDLDAGTLDIPRVRAAVDYAVAALEVADSRVVDWDISITDTVADNASSGLYVLGDQRVSLDEFEPVDVVMTMYVDEELVSEGSGAACLGDPLNALLWLAETVRDFGAPLRAGQVVLSGALGPMFATSPGVTVRAEISSLGAVTATFAGTDTAPTQRR